MKSVHNPDQMFSDRGLLPEKKSSKRAKAEKKKKRKKGELEV